jgi:hypothetical protein
MRSPSIVCVLDVGSAVAQYPVLQLERWLTLRD